MKKIKPNKKQLDTLKLYWKMLQVEETLFYNRIAELEEGMSKTTGIKDLEFFQDEMNMGFVGIGNTSRTMKLLQQDQLG
jgi:hypothetical protein